MAPRKTNNAVSRPPPASHLALYAPKVDEKPPAAALAYEEIELRNAQISLREREIQLAKEERDLQWQQRWHFNDIGEMLFFSLIAIVLGFLVVILFGATVYVVQEAFGFRWGAFSGWGLNLDSVLPRSKG